MVRMIMPVLISRDRFISLALSQLAPLLPSLLHTPGAADPEAVKVRLHGGAQLAFRVTDFSPGALVWACI